MGVQRDRGRTLDPRTLTRATAPLYSSDGPILERQCMASCGYWIYPGERRPVVVQAPTEKEAQEKVQKSPEYDGFGSRVYSVEKFAKLCELGEAP